MERAGSMRCGIRASSRAFTLIELLVCLGIIAILLSIILPAVHKARESGRAVLCLSNLKQLGTAWAAYAGDYKDFAMPLAYWDENDLHGGDPIYWWGDTGTPETPSDPARGFITPYLGSPLGARTVFECPAQPWGTYRPQGPTGAPTTTFGYNGYYLSPAKTPGWGQTIGFRPWRRLFEIYRPCELFVFADTLLGAGNTPRSTGLLDPPMLYSPGPTWTPNASPTTAFRHMPARAAAGVAHTVRADGAVKPAKPAPDRALSPAMPVGSASSDNDPCYVPDWREWR